jgi:hypothetical protein
MAALSIYSLAPATFVGVFGQHGMDPAAIPSHD